MAKEKKNSAKNETPKVQEAKNFEKAIAFLLTHEYVEKIYINKAGEYHLQEVPGFVEYSAADVIGETDSAGDETEDYVLTEEDFINNPDFEKQGLKVGDTIQIPVK
ncbi:hypothetical protein PV783_11610 [Chitinophaga sp. CC14]|uniref:hypothetical protein n=1 Tax=Chitinophaga sp. CC14 TaxID=3029199 RepID=UPI003B7B5521